MGELEKLMRRPETTHSKHIRLTEFGREKIETWAEANGINFSAAIETLALMGLDDSRADYAIPALRATTLQGSNVGAGGEGTFSMQVTINTTTAGRVEAFNTESGLRDSVRVFFNGGGGPQPQPASYHDFQPNQCQVTARVGAPSYSFPDGPAATPFATGGTFSALRGVRTGSGEVWFLVDYPPGASVPDAWVRASDLSNQSGTCSW